MKRTVKALQDLYVKLGGNLTDTYNGIAGGIKVGLYKRIPDIIEAVKEKASGGSGAGLPKVTAADNGDVLTVVEGAWAKAAPSGGVLIVGMEYDDAESKYTLTKTWQEIYDAVSQGIASVIVYKTPIDEYDHTYVITGVYYTGTVYAVSVATGDAIEYTTDQASGYPSWVDE